MLDEATRTAILKLAAAGHGARTIAQDLKLARTTVRRVIERQRRGAGDEARRAARALPRADP